MITVREARQRRAVRLAVRAEKRLARLSPQTAQPARRGSSPVPPWPGGRLGARLRAGVVSRALSHPRAAETAALVVGVTVGVVLVAVLLGSLLAGMIRAESVTTGGDA